jgi:Tfp pilus assembly protein, pilus retraction ATPase PilT
MIRVAGVISPSRKTQLLSAEDTRRLVIDALKEGQRAKLENEWQLDFALQVHDLGRYRGNACYVSGAIEANFRQIPFRDPRSKPRWDTLPWWISGVTRAPAWCLVTGASGEGKSTTLASMAQTIANGVPSTWSVLRTRSNLFTPRGEPGEPARGWFRRARLRFSAQERVETGCGRHSCGRVARPGHDPNCDYGGGNGAPCDWNHAHQRRANRHRANY